MDPAGDGLGVSRESGPNVSRTCFFTRAGYRKRGVSKALARAAVQHARDRGARALDGYPITTSNAIAEELHVGTEATFLQADFSEVSRPTKRRAVMRIDF